MAERRVLVARLDSDGDVLLAGPAVRAVAAHADQVTLLVGPRGDQAAELLPGVDAVLRWRAPWIDPEPEPVCADAVAQLVHALRDARLTEAVVLTSYHQSALPLALLLRMAGVRRVSAISDDYPGSLLDVRHRVDGDIPEVERNLSVAAAAGFPLPAGDDGRLRVRQPLPHVTGLVGRGPYLVVHPGASVPARAAGPRRCAEMVELLAATGYRVLVTGAPAERPLTALVAGRSGTDLGGRTSLRQLAAVLAGASAVVVGNTGPAHRAAAVGTPVVSLFAPVVPAARWAPYGVPHVLLGNQWAACRDSRARRCPVPGHPCLNGVSAMDVLVAVRRLTGARWEPQAAAVAP
jgi:ADP-heptose:LPS heptosyltransferase